MANQSTSHTFASTLKRALTVTSERMQARVDIDENGQHRHLPPPILQRGPYIENDMWSESLSRVWAGFDLLATPFADAEPIMTAEDEAKWRKRRWKRRKELQSRAGRPSGKTFMSCGI